MTSKDVLNQLTELFKYVRVKVEDGEEVRFSLAADYFAPSHKHMARNDKVVSAGFVTAFLRDGKLHVRTSGNSMTLRCGPVQDDEEFILDVLKRA